MANTPISKYELTHPLYEAMLPTYMRNADLYDGGKAMEGVNARKYLTQHPYEKDKQYEIRIKRAAYKNYAAPTIDLFASSIMDGAERTGLEDIPAFEPMLKNCDRQGSPPEKFFKIADTRAAAKGAEFVLVDMPKAQGEAITQAEARAQGLTSYFVRIPAENLISWGYDTDESLSWAVQKDERMEAPGPFQDHVSVKTITLWTKDGWTRFVSRDGSEYQQAESGIYTIGMVPIVPFLYEQETPMTGRSVIDDVASLVIRVFNQDSELDKMLFDAALPILAAYGLREDEEEVLVKATNFLWRFGDVNAKLQYVEPSGTSFAAKRQQIQDDVEGIREISLRQTKPRGAGVESAEAKRLDSVQLSSQLADFARNAAASERRCWEIAGKLAGVDQSQLDAVSIKYNETFDPDALREKLTQAYMELRGNGDISRETVWRHLGWTEEQIGEEKALLEDESRNVSGPSGSLAGSLTAALMGQGG